MIKMVEPKPFNHRIQIIKNQQLLKINPSTSTNKHKKTMKLNYIFIVDKKPKNKILTSKVNKKKDKKIEKFYLVLKGGVYCLN